MMRSCFTPLRVDSGWIRSCRSVAIDGGKVVAHAGAVTAPAVWEGRTVVDTEEPCPFPVEMDKTCEHDEAPFRLV